MPRTPHKEDCSCFKCKIQSVQFDTRAMPSRRKARQAAHPPRTPENSWEKGIPTDSRGMPYLRPDMQPAESKYVAANRSRFEANRKRVNQQVR